MITSHVKMFNFWDKSNLFPSLSRNPARPSDEKAVLVNVMQFLKDQPQSIVDQVLGEYHRHAKGQFRSDAPAIPIAIVNPSFEASVLTPGGFGGAASVTGWQIYNPNGYPVSGGGTTIGTWHITTPIVAIDGVNVMWGFLDRQPDDGDFGAHQVLTEVLEPNTRYVMTTFVSSYEGVPFDPSYKASLAAGGVELALFKEKRIIPDGEWIEVGIGIDIGKNHPLLGQPLEVRLLATESFSSSTFGLSFIYDHVTLTKQAIVEYL